jgi:hypothetical protein
MRSTPSTHKNSEDLAQLRWAEPKSLILVSPLQAMHPHKTGQPTQPTHPV